MRSKTITVVILMLAVSNAWPADLDSLPYPGSWAKVMTLLEGEPVTVTLKQGDKINGEFLRLDQESIALTVSKQERVYPKPAVSEVRRVEGGSKKKNAAIAGAALCAVGLGIGYAAAPYIADQDTMPAGERITVGLGVGAIWGGIAAGIAALSTQRRHEAVLYRAQ